LAAREVVCWFGAVVKWKAADSPLGEEPRVLCMREWGVLGELCMREWGGLGLMLGWKEQSE
jgi:hypothetical protein